MLYGCAHLVYRESGMNAAEQLTVQRVRDRLDEAISEELLDFWSSRNALAPQQARERLPQVLSVLRNQSGTIVGVNSAGTGRVALLGHQVFDVYRCLLAGEASEPACWMKLLESACGILDEKAADDGGSRSAIGMLVQIPDRSVQLAYPDAVWPSTDLVHAGFLDNGVQMRVRYYPGAVIDSEAAA